MEKENIKKYIMSLRNPQNEARVNFLLGKLDMMTQNDISEYFQKFDSDKAVQEFLKDKLQQKQPETHQEHTPINKMITYGINGNCIHLHLPGDLHEMISSIGIKKTFDTVNLYLLDAIDKLKNLKDSGFYEFSETTSIYMISPILLNKELNFLENMDFEVNLHKKKDLSNPEYVSTHPEAQLATHIFGNDKNIGSALIHFETISAPAWQEKRANKIKEFNNNGIFINQENPVK